LGDTDSETAETLISSPPQHHSDHEDSEFALFRSQMSAGLMKNFVDNICHALKVERGRNLALCHIQNQKTVQGIQRQSAWRNFHGRNARYLKFTKTSTPNVDGRLAMEIRYLQCFGTQGSIILSDIKSLIFQSLLARLDHREESETEFECFNLWVEEDGEQEVKMHVRKFKGLFLEILTDAYIGGVDLFADPKIGKDENESMVYL